MNFEISSKVSYAVLTASVASPVIISFFKAAICCLTEPLILSSPSNFSAIATASFNFCVEATVTLFSSADAETRALSPVSPSAATFLASTAASAASTSALLTSSSSTVETCLLVASAYLTTSFGATASTASFASIPFFSSASIAGAALTSFVTIISRILDETSLPLVTTAPVPVVSSNPKYTLEEGVSSPTCARTDSSEPLPNLIIFAETTEFNTGVSFAP